MSNIKTVGITMIFGIMCNTFCILAAFSTPKEYLWCFCIGVSIIFGLQLIASAISDNKK